MRRLITTACAALALCLASAITAQTDRRAIWIDFDFHNIAEPKARPDNYYSAFFKSDFTERLKQATNVTKLANIFSDNKNRASNVNAFDEVPDSSWYTNRHALRPMTADELARGPDSGEPPDFSRVIITKAKQGGITPGMQVLDNKGRAYLIKFDHKDYPELQSGAEVISTKVFYAAGYNVPENYVANLNPDNLEIKPGLEIGRGKEKRPFTPEDLKQMLENAARQPDGTYRALASRMLTGVPKGPFAFVGVRSDDPNDLIPHQNRRELRGLRVIASWLNHWDMKEMNTLDMYVEEGGRKFLRHYLIDFGSTLGAGSIPTEYYHGREYSFDKGSIGKEIITLGVFTSADEKTVPITYPALGLFTADDFDPGRWRSSFHVAPFDQMTRDDAFWATRIIMSFSDDDLRRIVLTGKYSDPKVSELVFETLRLRRQMIARYWLSQVNPIVGFVVNKDPQGDVTLRFTDLLSRHNLDGPAEYSYSTGDAVQHGGKLPKSGVTVTKTSEAPVGDPGVGTCVQVWTHRAEVSRPTNVCIKPDSGGIYRITAISRQ
jgi:hypothetical protein